MTDATLMFTTDGSRFFLVPDPTALPDGDLAVRSTVGHARNVDADAIAPFLVDREAAEAHLKNHLTSGVEQVMEHLRRVGKAAIQPEPPDDAERARQRDAAESLEQLADWLSGGLRSLAQRIRERGRDG